ncbi:hypothetical protein JCM8097_001454 [Rhodosporidiobolus ruineniae]
MDAPPPPARQPSTFHLPDRVQLSPAAVSSFKPAKVFCNHNEQGSSFTSLAFDRQGDYLLTSGEDMTMQLFDVQSGEHVKEVKSKKYGVDLARFTHSSSSVIHASTQGENYIRYLSLHDNQYLRYFPGHKKRVTSLAMSPCDDTFLSGAADDTVRLWDLRTPTAQGVLDIGGHAPVAYSPDGTVFAVAVNLRSRILVYDLAAFDREPIDNFQIDDPVAREWFPPRPPILTSVAFSPDGNYLLVGTSGDVHYVLDAFDGNMIAQLVGPPGSLKTGLERSSRWPHDRDVEPSAGLSGEEVKWTPDGRFVVSGSIAGKLLLYDVHPPPLELEKLYPNRPPPGPDCQLHPVKVLRAHRTGPSRCVVVDPRRAMWATGGVTLAFWLPDPVAGSPNTAEESLTGK